MLRGRGYACPPLSSEQQERLKWLFPAKRTSPKPRARSAHRTGRAQRPASAGRALTVGTSESSTSSSDDGGDPEPEPPKAHLLPPTPAAVALADAVGQLIADLLHSGAVVLAADEGGGSPSIRFTTTPGPSSGPAGRSATSGRHHPDESNE